MMRYFSDGSLPTVADKVAPVAHPSRSRQRQRTRTFWSANLDASVKFTNGKRPGVPRELRLSADVGRAGATVANVISLAEPAPGSPPQSARYWRRQRRSTSRRRVTTAPMKSGRSGMIVARVHRVPTPIEKHVKPGIEIHRCWVWRHADVAEISVAVARRNVHAAAERDREMREVAAHADALGVGFIGRARRTRALIAERDVAVDEIADRLHPRPARGRMAEKVPGNLAEFVGLDVRR